MLKLIITERQHVALTLQLIKIIRFPQIFKQI